MTAPRRVRDAQARADAAGFELSCGPDVGRLLAVLAAAVPPGGLIVELGTGAGVGTAWLVEGLRPGVRLVTIDIDPEAIALAAGIDWPSAVDRVNEDALEVLERTSDADLIFADAPAGKWTGLDATVAALRPGGVFVVDDMAQADDPSSPWRDRIHAARTAILGHAGLMTAELAFGSGVILGVRR